MRWFLRELVSYLFEMFLALALPGLLLLGATVALAGAVVGAHSTRWGWATVIAGFALVFTAIGLLNRQDRKDGPQAC